MKRRPSRNNFSPKHQPNNKPDIMNPTRIMLDIETLDTKPGACIFAIGAVEFADGQITREFYELINPTRSQWYYGFTFGADTLRWWMDQNEAARLELKKAWESTDTVGAVLAKFSKWMGNATEPEVWGNGADFDNVILEAAYRRLDVSPPWSPRKQNRCYKTVRALCPQVPCQERTGVHHHALHDAKTQAIHLMRMMGYAVGSAKMTNLEGQNQNEDANRE